MAIIKCKSCGGDLEIIDGSSVAECLYCGTKQTLPALRNENVSALFNRANALRMKSEFDKAEEIYEKILQMDDGEAEAYWGLILCRYGVEYVEDPKTMERIPTCHRTSYEAVTADEDYKSALRCADVLQREVYESEAKRIDTIQKGILDISKKEKPYDVFICYKETDENGKRTVDSTIANDIYYQLTQEGFKVFYAAITLEDKLGQEYEPYIFAALNSAKVMLVIGTKPEYFNAVWVKNEWSRYLKLMKTDRSKLLIPCYRDMDAYDLPEDFSHLQAQDMGKIGFINDVVRGIKKVIAKEELQQEKETVVVQQESGSIGNIAPLLKRAFMFLEDGNWKDADDYCEKVLDQDPENAEAYLGKLMAELKVGKRENLKNCAQPFDGRSNYQKVLRFGDAVLADKIIAANESVVARNQAAEERLAAEKKAAAERRAAEEKAAGERRTAFCARTAPAQKLLSVGDNHTVGLKADGTVVAVGDNYYGQRTVYGWRDIVAVSAGDLHTVGLKADGTVVAVGANGCGQCGVSGWRDIVAVSARFHTVGLKADGTVVAVGDNDYGQCDVDDWRDIAAVSAGLRHTVGLKANGTVVAVGKNESGECDVDDWRDIVAISAGRSHTVGLKADGTVVAVGKNESGECDVDGWQDIVAVSAGNDYTVGLKSDGTAFAFGWNRYGECDMDGWQDIVAVSAGSSHTVGLKTDGTVVAVGDNNSFQCDVDGWKLFSCIDLLEEECAAAKAAAEKAADERRLARIATLDAEKSALNTELANLKGMFSGKRRKEIEARLVQIDVVLNNLK